MSQKNAFISDKLIFYYNKFFDYYRFCIFSNFIKRFFIIIYNNDYFKNVIKLL